jgi:RND superfamily putative drug exporter
VTRAAVWLLLRLRFLVIPAWIAVAVLAAQRLPAIGSGQENALGGLVPEQAHAIEVEHREFELFGSVLSSRVAVVQRRAGGFRPGEQQRVFTRALAIDRHQVPLLRHIAFALPITNGRGLFPSSRERDTTAVTFLFYAPGTSLNAQLALADTYAQRIAARGDALIGVTGALPARESEFREIERALPRVTLATLLLIAIVLSLVYRAFAPPVVALGAAGIVYVIATHALEWFARERGTSIPQEVEPVMVALLLGLVTDYAVFFYSGTRRRLEAGDDGVEATGQTARLYVPIILTAGLIVAAGALTLVIGRLPVFRAFGPGLALTVLVCLAVSLTFVPAALAILGRAFFWPSLRADESDRDDDDDAGTVARWRAGRLLSLPLALVAVAALGAAAYWTKDTALGFTLIRGQPANAEVKRAELAASLGFDRGIIAPTTLLLEGDDLDSPVRHTQLAALETRLEREQGVAGVVGPREQLRSRRAPRVFVSRDGKAARIAVILRQEPFGSNAVHIVRDLGAAAPGLLDETGLDGVRVDFAGDTALAAQTVDAVRHDVVRVAGGVLLANFLLLALFLRALVAPLYLLAASTLGLAASLGLTTLVFEHVLGHQDLTYYVPFAASVLLLSLGSDYNLFVVGRIWQETERRPLREAIAYAVPRASRTITTAGMILSGSFALLALVPIRPMRELAFAMAAGILIDTFLVRSLLVPSLVALFGRWSWWPRTPPTPRPEAPRAASRAALGTTRD